MRLRVDSKFTYAVNGYTVTDFKPGDNDSEGGQEVPDDAAAYALKEGFAVECDAEGKAVAKAPENKARGKGK